MLAEDAVSAESHTSTLVFLNGLVNAVQHARLKVGVDRLGRTLVQPRILSIVSHCQVSAQAFDEIIVRSVIRVGNALRIFQL